MNKGTHFIGQLMYYVNPYSFFEAPEKDWLKMLEETETPPPEPTLFD